MYVVLVKGLSDDIYGPFDSPSDASLWAQMHFDRNYKIRIVALTKP